MSDLGRVLESTEKVDVLPYAGVLLVFGVVLFALAVWRLRYL